MIKNKDVQKTGVQIIKELVEQYNTGSIEYKDFAGLVYAQLCVVSDFRKDNKVSCPDLGLLRSARAYKGGSKDV